MLYDKQLEKAILSSSVNWTNRKHFGLGKLLIENTEEADFYTTENKNIFLLIKKSVEKECSPNFDDLINIGATNEDKNNISELMDIAGFSDPKPFYKRLKIIAKCRDLIFATMNLDKLFSENIENIEDKFEEAEKKILAVLAKKISNKTGFYTKERLEHYYSNLEKEMDGKKKYSIKIGISKFDEITGGARPGENIIIAGRPGMGKSALALTIIAYCILNKIKCSYFSLELTEKEIFNKLFSMLSDLIYRMKHDEHFRVIPYHFLRNPKPNAQFLKSMMEVTPYLDSESLYYNFDPSQDIRSIKSICRDLKFSKHDLNFAFIDHIGRLVKNRSQEYAELTQISSDCKNIALELGITMFPLVQLSRASEKAEEPNMSHLKGTGAFEEDADLCLFPWRPFAIDKKQPPEMAKLITGKARNDFIPPIRLNFSTITTLFSYDDTKLDEEYQQF